MRGQGGGRKATRPFCVRDGSRSASRSARRNGWPRGRRKGPLSGWSISSLDSADFTITADFADGGIGGTSAVNTYRGPYETGPDAAFSVGEITSTMMAGPEPEMRAEKANLTLLAEAASCSREGDTLTLYDKGGNESLIFAADGQ